MIGKAIPMKMRSSAFPIFGATLASAMLAEGGALRDYTQSATYDIGVNEASGVTYNRDTGTLFSIGDEGEALYQISKTGQAIDRMTFDNSQPRGNRALDDPEGVSYMGAGKFIIADERIGTGWITAYAAGTQVGVGVMQGLVVAGTNDSNSGLEGVGYDPITDSLWGVKEANPIGIFMLSNVSGGGQRVTTIPFPSNRFTRAGITSLSDIYIMASCASFALDDPRRMHILVLARNENLLLEMTRTGEIVDTLDISRFGKHTIEGLTMDDDGHIYLASEKSGTMADNLHVLWAPGSAVSATGYGKIASSFSISWSNGGNPVILERSTTMEDGSWQPLTLSPTDVSTGTFNDATAPADNAFYRIRRP